MSDAEPALLALEARRMAAMEAGDGETLAALLAEDFTQIHGDGSVDDRAGAIAAAVAMPRRVVTPRELSVRRLGDVALLTGPVTLAVTIDGAEREVRVFIGQLAERRAEGWRYVWSQVTMMPPAT